LTVICISKVHTGSIVDGDMYLKVYTGSIVAFPLEQRLCE